MAKKRRKPQVRREGDPQAAALLSQKRALSRLAASTRWLTRAAGTLLASIFAWLKLNDVPFAQITAEPAASVLLRSALVAYYFSWIVAVGLDTRDEEDVLYAVPNDGRFPAAALAILIAISVGFGILCWVNSYPQFVIALGTFWVLNFLAWRYLLRSVISPALERSYTLAATAGGPFDTEKLRLLDSFLRGRWQWSRFGAGAISIGVLAALTHPSVAEPARASFGFASSSGLGASAIALHLALFEGWIWWRRIERRVGIRLLERLEPSHFGGKR